MTQLLSDNHFVGEDAHLMGGAFTALTPAFLQPSSPASDNTPSPCTDHADSHEGRKPHPVEKVPASQHEEPPVPPCTDIADSHGLDVSTVLVEEHAAQQIQKQTNSTFFILLPLQHQQHSDLQYLSSHL